MRIPVALVGATVERTAFDWQVRLSLIAREPDEGCRLDAELVLETPFLLRDAAGQWHELDPGTGAHLAPVLDLFGKKITELVVSDQGALTLGFDDGAGLSASPHAQYESWSVHGTGIEPVQVGPSGETDWHN